MKVRAQDDMHFKKEFYFAYTRQKKGFAYLCKQHFRNDYFFHFDLHFIHSKQVLLRSNKHSSIFSWLLDQKRVSLKINCLNVFCIIDTLGPSLGWRHNSKNKIDNDYKLIKLALFTTQIILKRYLCNVNFRTTRSNSSSSHLLIIIYIMYLKQLTGVSNIERIQRNEVH